MDERERTELAELRQAQLTRPSAARMYDYLLGGAANFSYDRAAAEQVVAAFPLVRTWAQANRAFLRRVVAHLCDRGIAQYLDLGSGIPTVGNVHEIAQRYLPSARVAYVDWDPVAVTHARRLLDGRPGVSVTQADIRHPERVVAEPGVAGLLDFTQPVAVLAFAILHAVADRDEPERIVAGYRDACRPGSCLAISHGVVTTLTDDQVDRFVAAYRNTPTPATFRTAAQVRALFQGYEMVDPGVVLLDEWRPDDPADAARAAENNCYGGVGVLP